MALVRAALEVPAQERESFLSRRPSAAVDVCQEALAILAELPADEFLCGSESGQTKNLSGTELGDYRVGVQIGQGGTAQVYRAVHRASQQVVALKVLIRPFGTDPAALLGQLRRQAGMLEQVDHPAVVRPIGIGEQDGHAYLALEYVEGSCLVEAVQGLCPSRDNQDRIRQVVDWIGQLAEVLDAVHRAGILHCDLKPDNVLVGADGTIRLIDFGVALRTRELGDVTPGDLRGTPGYLSPEQLSATRALATEQTDIYACGAVLQRALAEIPGRTGSDLPSALQRALTKALAPDPVDRHPSARALADDLRRAL